jgi:hypothetical protein
MRYFSTLIRTVLAGLLVIGIASGAAVAGDKQGVVLQVSDNDPAKWNLALNNAKNVQQEMGKDNVQIEIVAYGPGINMFKFDSEVNGRLAAAEKDGIQLSACGNTMKAQKLTAKDLDSHVQVVPAGVIEIMTKQKSGWAYVRP